MPSFRVFCYDSTREIYPRSTNCETDALTTMPSCQFFLVVSFNILVNSQRTIIIFSQHMPRLSNSICLYNPFTVGLHSAYLLFFSRLFIYNFGSYFCSHHMALTKTLSILLKNAFTFFLNYNILLPYNIDATTKNYGIFSEETYFQVASRHVPSIPPSKFMSFL